MDVKRVQPQGEDSRLTLAFGIEIVDLSFFFLGDRVEAGVRVEQVGYESEVEFRVTGYEGGGREELAAVELVGVLEDLFGTLVKISSL